MSNTNEVMAMAASAARSRMELCPSVICEITKSEYEVLYTRSVVERVGMNGFVYFKTSDDISVCYQKAFGKYVILSYYQC